MEEVLLEASKLSVAERILLVEAIWDSIAGDTPAPFLEDHLHILNEREEEYKSGSVKTFSWEEAKKKIEEGIRNKK